MSLAHYKGIYIDTSLTIKGTSVSTSVGGRDHYLE